MKPYLYILFFLMLMPVTVISQSYLYPPLNLQADGVECSVFLDWDQPELPGGGLPPGVLGYNVYRENTLLAYSPGPDTTWMYDIEPEPCPSNTHTYWVTALYDLGYYGNPGQIGESVSSDTVPVPINCSYPPLPFTENWDMASFYFYGWRFEPDQGNWAMSVSLGNPLPSAGFAGTPTVQNYSYALVSRYLPTNVFSQCTDIFLDFDLKLDNVVGSGTEMLIVEYAPCGSPWDTIIMIDNSAGFGWTHYSFDLNGARGVASRIMFRATGQNSANIQQWLVDNIVVSFSCRPPSEPSLSVSEDVIHLIWHRPACDNGLPPGNLVIGYNVYRTDDTGLPPFTKLNSAPVVDTTYNDENLVGNFPGTYNYCIRSLQNDTTTNSFLCESPCLDTLTAVITGIGTSENAGCSIAPNPSTGQFRIDLPRDAQFLEISDLHGRTIYTQDLSENPSSRLDVDLSNHHPGWYLLTIKTKTGLARNKIVIY